MRITQRPYHLLLFTGLALILISFFVAPNKVVDFHVHDTKYVIAHLHIFWLLAFIVWLLWFLYLMLHKFLHSKTMTWIHVIVTLLTVIFLMILLGNNLFYPQPRRYLDLNDWHSFDRYDRHLGLIGYCIVAMLLGQVIFIINLIIGVFNQRKR